MSDTKELDAKGRDIVSEMKEVPEGVEICCWSTPVSYQAYDRTCDKDFEGRPVQGINVSVVQCPDCGFEKTCIGGPAFDYWNDEFKWDLSSSDPMPKKRQVHLITGGHVWWQLERCWTDSRVDYPEQYPPQSYFTRFKPSYVQEEVRTTQGERGRLRRIWKHMIQDLTQAKRAELEDFMMARCHDPKYFQVFVEDPEHEDDIQESFFYQHPATEGAYDADS